MVLKLNATSMFIHVWGGAGKHRQLLVDKKSPRSWPLIPTIQTILSKNFKLFSSIYTPLVRKLRSHTAINLRGERNTSININ